MRVPLLLAVPLFLTAAVLSSPSVASAQPAGIPSLAWQSPVTFDKAHDGGLGAVSCATVTVCSATESSDVVRLSGGKWSAPRNIAPHPAGNGLGAISCPTTQFCAAMGYDGQSSPGDTYFVLYQGHAWSVPTVIPGAAGHAAISCPNATDCWAIDFNASLYHYDGSGWNTDYSLQTPFIGMQAISCPTTTFCAAVGDSGFFTIYNGSSWSPVTNIGATAGLGSVSCTSAKFCVAVDFAGTAYVYDGIQWSSGAPTGAGTVTAVSCAGGRHCVAVDQAGNASVYSSGTWTTEVVDPAAAVTSISCVTATACVAVAVNLNHTSYDGGGTAYRYDGKTWTPAAVDRSEGYPFGLSCSAVSQCLATDEVGRVWTYNGQWASAANSPAAALRSPYACGRGCAWRYPG
jgi:hypothetical protein